MPQELRGKNGRLLKRWRNGKAGLPAHLEDYAFFVQGLLDLQEATFDSEYLKAAKELIDLTLLHFEDKEKGGFYLSANDGEKLLVRAKEIYDGAIPSGNSVMALNLLRLGKITGDAKYLSAQTLCFPPFRDSWKTIRNPPKSCYMLFFTLSSPAEIVICGERNDERTQALIKKSIGASFPLRFSCFMTPKNRMRNSSRLRLFSSIRKWRMVCQPSSFAGTKLAIGPKTGQGLGRASRQNRDSLSLFFASCKPRWKRSEGELAETKPDWASWSTIAPARERSICSTPNKDRLPVAVINRANQGKSPQIKIIKRRNQK